MVDEWKESNCSLLERQNQMKVEDLVRQLQQLHELKKLALQVMKVSPVPIYFDLQPESGRIFTYWVDKFYNNQTWKIQDVVKAISSALNVNFIEGTNPSGFLSVIGENMILIARPKNGKT
jgi:hypothetical protein